MSVTETKQKMIQNLEKVILLILEILQNYYSTESREGIETLRTMFRIPHEYLMLYCFTSDFFFFGISRQTVIMAFCILEHGWYMLNNSVAAVFIVLATNRSCGNICYFD